MRLIETILFGRPIKPPALSPAITRRPRRSPRALPPAANPFAASNDEFFRTLILRKRVTQAPRPPVTPAPAAPVTATFARTSSRIAGPSGPFGPSGPSFPRGLCYLVGVAPSDRAAAMLSLGSYPVVQSLLTSWLFQPAGIHLVTHSLTRSLYIMLHAGWTHRLAGEARPLRVGRPVVPSPACSILALSPPNVGSARLTASYLGAALLGGPDWVHSVKQSNRARLGGQETAPPHPRACGVGVEVLAGAAGVRVPLARPPSVHSISMVIAVAAVALSAVMSPMWPGRMLTNLLSISPLLT